jgi:SPOR domain
MAIPEMRASQGPIAAQLIAKTGVLVQYAGALVSLALVAGVGVWGYQLLVRDMTGIPVVRAMDGPMREAPSNPGGEIVPHLGLSVNEVAAAGEAAPPEERLLLAPMQTQLSEDDLLTTPMAEAGEPDPGAVASSGEMQVPVTALVETPQPLADPALLAAPALAPDTVPGAANLPQDATAGMAMDATATTPPSMTAADVLALADQIASGTAPLTDLAPGPDLPAVVALDGAATIASGAVIDRSVPGVVTALVPMARPADHAANADVGAVNSAVMAAAEHPALTTDIPLGTNLVQLGAYETPEIAAQEWDILSGRFAEFMTDKDKVIQQASSGGRTFFRLRAMGFADLGEARSFCAALAAENAACIPVVVR